MMMVSLHSGHCSNMQREIVMQSVSAKGCTPPHCTQYTVHSTLYLVRCTFVYIVSVCTLYNVHGAWYIVNSKQYIVRSTQYTVHST